MKKTDLQQLGCPVMFSSKIVHMKVAVGSVIPCKYFLNDGDAKSLLNRLLYIRPYRQLF